VVKNRSPLRGDAWVGSNLAHIHKTMVEVAENAEYVSLMRNILIVVTLALDK
jgi:hypothetical protein